MELAYTGLEAIVYTSFQRWRELHCKGEWDYLARIVQFLRLSCSLSVPMESAIRTILAENTALCHSFSSLQEPSYIQLWEEIMLKFDISPALLRESPVLDAAERRNVRGLARGLHVMHELNADCSIEKTTDLIFDILRKSFQRQNPTLFNSQRMLPEEWFAICGYYTDSYADCYNFPYTNVRIAYQLAQRKFQNVQIRGRRSGSEIVICGWEPGHEYPTLVARAVPFGDHGPSLSDFVKLDAARRSMWQYGWAAMTGPVVGVMVYLGADSAFGLMNAPILKAAGSTDRKSVV